MYYISKMSQIWFTSDQHFGHRNIIKYSNRPFRDVDHMTTELINRHNSAVAKEDTVWHLGDFALDEKLVKPLLSKLNGVHHLISGNHDRCHSCHSRSTSAKRRYESYGFKEIYEQIMLDLPPLGEVMLCHMPYEGDSRENLRYMEFRPKDEGKLLLHGHVHEKWRFRNRIDTSLSLINIGVDQWNYTPVSTDQIAEAISCVSNTPQFAIFFQPEPLRDNNLQTNQD